MKERFAGQLVRREDDRKIRLLRPWRKRGVILRLIRNHRPFKLRDSFADPLRRHLGRAEGRLKERRIKRRLAELGHDFAKRRTHFARALNRDQRLCLKRLSPLVPESSAADVVVPVRQRHRVPPGQLAIDARAELIRIGKPVLLPVARRTRRAPSCDSRVS